jgi:serine/threonine protein kinase
MTLTMPWGGASQRKIIMAQNTQVCGNCGTVNTSTAQFCANCGYLLAGGPVHPTIQADSSNMPTTIGVSTSHRITGALMAGNLLGSRYRIVEMIGKGGFGAVYKARDERFPSKPIVAIKEMSDAQLSPSEKTKALQDFRNEADLLVQLKHPNLPNVSDVFEEGGKAYLVMEFIEGKTLANIQDEQSDPLDERLVMGWALQLCVVLHYLHTRPQPIIFRDMKPSNVMVTADGEIKLIDFGIARIFKTAGKKDTSLLGSQGYAPLEQYGRGQSDARSDIYALGATLYDLLTKELPADAPSRRINPTSFSSPRQLNPNISPAVEAVILKAMAEEPQDRYQSAIDMYRAVVATGIADTGNTILPTSGPFASMFTSQPGLTNYPTTPSTLASTQGNPMVTTAGPTQSSTGGVANVVGQGRQTGGAQYSQQPSGPVLAPPNVPGYPPQPAAPTRRALLIGGSAIVGAAIVGGTAFFLINKNRNGPGSATGGTLNLNFTYSTEKQAWMREVISDFNKSNKQVGNKLIQIQDNSLGSVDAANKILSGDLKPAAWSPASDLELNQLINNWQKKYGNQEIVHTSGDMRFQALVLSPLVFAAWQDRFKLLQAKYQTIDWSTVHNALQLSSWSDIGGQASWGAVKLGQTRPDSSNSGLLSITLLAYSYHQTTRGLSIDKIQDPGFLKYLTDVEGNVSQFGRSSGTYIQNEVIVYGPSKYDIVTTYENLVLTLQKTAQQRQGQPLIPSYPSLNIVSNHPFAIFTNVSQEEQMAAKVFLDFLLDVPQQRKAVLSGFRPINPNVPLNDSIPGNPFTDASLGFKVPDQLPPQVQAPTGDVTDELLKQWYAKYNSVPTALSISTGQTQRIM